MSCVTIERAYFEFERSNASRTTDEKNTHALQSCGNVARHKKRQTPRACKI